MVFASTITSTALHNGVTWPKRPQTRVRGVGGVFATAGKVVAGLPRAVGAPAHASIQMCPAMA